MTSSATNPLLAPFLATAESVARARPEVDGDMVREIFDEAATLLHNGLVLDGLDDHDTSAAIDGLCTELVAADPGEALRARAESTLQGSADVHDREGVAAAYLTAAALMGI